MKRNILIFSIITLFCFGQTKGQQVYFEHLDLKDGLSQISVTALQQDQMGMVWIGTRDGLNRYNGYEVEVFRHENGDSTSILGNNIRKIGMGDKQMWILTPEGISRFDLQTEKVRNFPNENVKCIHNGEESLWVGTTQGLFYLDSLSGRYLTARNIFPKMVPVNEVYEDGAGKVWIGCADAGLYVYNPVDGKLDSIIQGGITSIFESEKGDIWVGTSEDGVYCIRNGQPIEHIVNRGESKSLSHNVIRDISEDKQGRIWIGTFYGITVYDPVRKSFHYFYQSDKRPYGLSHNSIYTLFRDQRGSIWIGTYFGGVNIYNPDFNVFKYYGADASQNKSISYRVVGAMLEDDDKNLWIATEGGGLNFYDRKKHTFRYYPMGESDRELSHNNVKSLYLDDRNKLWVGTHFGGLNVLDLKTNRIRKYQKDNKAKGEIPSNVISAILPFGENLLLGTNSGVVLYNRQTDHFASFFENKNLQKRIGSKILSLMMDQNQCLWIGSETKGLSVFDLKTGEIRHYRYNASDANSLGSNCVYQIYQDHMRRIWVATSGGGLSRFLPETESFRNYTRKEHGLPSDFIYGIAESRYGFLWIATSKGISRFDVEDEKFLNYDYNNGFPLVEINERGLYITSDGEVFVGGIHGMVSFFEKELQNKMDPTPLYLTSLSVNNQEVHPGDESGILSKALPFTREIHLNHNHSVISFEFTSLNFLQANKNKYHYKLEGFDENWVNAGYRRSATYTNLKPGTYTFRVREDMDGMAGEVSSASMKICIAPPFYNTWWAYLFYAAIFAGILIYINRMLISKALLEDKLKMEQVERERINELNQSKLRFFTNISHEFRTPLTLIFGMLENVLEDSRISSSLYDKLLVAYKNSFRLKKLIDELLEFRKQELGHMKLKVNERDFVAFSREIFESFKEYASYHKIDYRFVTSQEEMAVWFDPRQMEKVFFNLLSNAFKFTPEKGSVYFLVDQKEDCLHVKVMDSGSGMSQEYLDKIFDRFYQVDNLTEQKNRQMGTGIGLALSKGIVEAHGGRIRVESRQGEGSCFEVVLPLGRQHFQVEQISGEDSYQLELFASQEFMFNEEMTEVEEEFVGSEVKECTILLVEDNPEMRAMLRSNLSSVYDVIEAIDGEEGLRMAREKQPDLIISDVMMPKMSGTEMCGILKSDLATCHIPVILLTAKGALEYKVEGLETGAEDYITKPFNMKLLLVRCKNLIRSRKKLQEKYRKMPEFEVKDIAGNSLDMQLMEKAIEIVEKNLDNPKFDVTAFASEMCLGRTNLYAKLKGVTGQTPNEFILTIRLKKAAAMLKADRGITVAEVAYSVGFSTPRYFSKCFSDHFGVTPSKYAREE